MFFTETTKCSRKKCDDRAELQMDSLGNTEDSFCSWECHLRTRPIHFTLEKIAFALLLSMIGIGLIVGIMFISTLSFTHAMLIFIISLLIFKK